MAQPDASHPGYSGFVDGLRGFALIGVCIVNLTFLAAPVRELAAPPAGLDAVAIALVAFLFEGKFFLLFSALFGFGFAVLMARVSSGQDTGAAYARRLAGLGVLGMLHAVLLFPGDILLTYALLGGLLWRVRHWTDCRLLKLALVLSILAAAVFGLGGLAYAVAEGEVRSGAVASSMRDADAAAQAYRGTFGQAMARRAVDWAYALVTLLFSQWPPTFAAMCCGVVAQRRRLLTTPWRLQAVLRRRVPLLVAGALAGNLAWAAFPWLPASLEAVSSLLLVLGAPCLSALYALGLAEAWRGAGRRMVLALAPAGRMSLTNYLGQSLVANAVFMGWGLGLYGYLGRPALLAVALAISGGLVVLSHAWLRRFRIGPAEWLLRSWTALRWLPLLHQRAPADTMPP